MKAHSPTFACQVGHRHCVVNLGTDAESLNKEELDKGK
ncbi:hypothetical protein APHCRT_0990 [Anaplasma phagocytophilum str. CRT53-1]|uniref:Uncharacterized protein n=1 Tax=Anaplasma phagocytophilum str. CRT53-1 TaxID=1359157 RepID=A0A0F3Q0B2_ANAPH|nr:hypothetical protein APHCRT_0990 [Anaplasma phagocytophilum str. CRT53-1]